MFALLIDQPRIGVLFFAARLGGTLRVEIGQHLDLGSGSEHFPGPVGLTRDPFRAHAGCPCHARSGRWETAIPPATTGARLEIFGDGDAGDELEAQIEASGVADRIAFSRRMFRVEDISAMIQGASVGIICNRRDLATEYMLPVKLLEYVQLGIPAIVPRLMTIQYYFSEAQVEYYEPGNIDELAAALSRLYGDAGKHARNWPAREVGYVALTNVRKAAPSDKAWSATVTREGNVARFVAAGETQTEVIVGDGHYGLETPPAILERRKTAATSTAMRSTFPAARKVTSRASSRRAI